MIPTPPFFVTSYVMSTFRKQLGKKVPLRRSSNTNRSDAFDLFYFLVCFFLLLIGSLIVAWAFVGRGQTDKGRPWPLRRTGAYWLILTYTCFWLILSIYLFYLVCYNDVNAAPNWMCLYRRGLGTRLLHPDNLSSYAYYCYYTYVLDWWALSHWWCCSNHCCLKTTVVHK